MKNYYKKLEFIKTKIGINIENYSLISINLQNYNYIKKLDINYNLFEYYHNQIKGLLHGDEQIINITDNNYLVIIENANLDEFLQYLYLITIPFNEDYISIKCKTGIYNMKENVTIEEAIENVTLALDVAESTSINNSVYSEQLKQKIMLKQEIISYFIHAIKNHEFEVYYQPKIDLNTNTLYGSEALVRWRKNGILMSPADFIPVLESEDLICQLDFYMLENVCKDIKMWQAIGIIPTKTSINFSKNNLLNPNFSNNIIKVLEKYNIESKFIEIELTETADSLNYESMIEFVETMKKNNINVSIDDFGTGSSTLNLVKSLSVNTIKIDKTFIDNIQNKKDAILVKAIIEMALNIGMDVIAEGTETKEQIDILYDLGCVKIQGYYFDKPLPKEEYVKRLENKCNCYQKQFSSLTQKKGF